MNIVAAAVSSSPRDHFGVRVELKRSIAAAMERFNSTLTPKSQTYFRQSVALPPSSNATSPWLLMTGPTLSVRTTDGKALPRIDTVPVDPALPVGCHTHSVRPTRDGNAPPPVTSPLLSMPVAKAAVAP